MKAKRIEGRLEYLRRELRAERISYAELAELQSLAAYISNDDVELLQAAGVPEEQKPVDLPTCEAIFNKFSNQGWNTDSKLTLCMQFLDQLPLIKQKEFEEFLQAQADEENSCTI